ncbi:hypothetical protein N9V96_03490 [Polaribacter sp.]|nr:hypothetical protein [Polaribacter sp.]
MYTKKELLKEKDFIKGRFLSTMHQLSKLLVKDSVVNINQLQEMHQKNHKQDTYFGVIEKVKYVSNKNSPYILSVKIKYNYISYQLNGVSGYLIGRFSLRKLYGTYSNEELIAVNFEIIEK